MPIVKGSTKAIPLLMNIKNIERSILLLEWLNTSQPIMSIKAVTIISMRIPPKTRGKVDNLYDDAVMSKRNALLKVKIVIPIVANFVQLLSSGRGVVFRKKLKIPKLKIIIAEIVK